MNTLYSSLAGTASSMLQRYGTRIIMRRMVSGRYFPATGRHERVDKVEWQPHALKTGVHRLFNLPFRSEENDAVLFVDVHNQPRIPQPGDTAIIGGAEWQVVRAMPVEPADTLVLGKYLIRRGAA